MGPWSISTSLSSDIGHARLCRLAAAGGGAPARPAVLRRVVPALERHQGRPRRGSRCRPSAVAAGARCRLFFNLLPPKEPKTAAANQRARTRSQDQRWYWYGESKKTGDLAAHGVNCYSAPDISGPWTSEGQVLHQSSITLEGKAGPYLVERPKVLYNEPTRLFVMWFHLDDA
jgi:hypothetical protein|eukprot:402577-Prymnesium_polylepis.1